MSVSRTAIGSALAVVLVATSITPAMARGGWYGGGGGGGHHRKHRDNDTGEVLAGVLIGAVLVGALASASKKKRDAARVDGRDYPKDARDRDYDRRDDRTQGDIRNEDAAVDACALAAEDRVGSTASVRDISGVTRSDDGWDVQGVIESRSGWRDTSAERRKFACSVRFGLVDSVYVEDGRVASRP